MATEAATPKRGTESEEEQRERYRELLEEVRTLLPGVQVLFAFLLIAPFSAQFEELDALGRDGHMVAMVSAATATVLLLAPTSYHRIAPRQARKARLDFGVAMTIAGMIALAIAIGASIFVVTRFVYGPEEAVGVVAGLTAVVALIWYLFPLWRRLRR